MQHALIAQLDRVQVSEACGVGSSPAERTITPNKISSLYIVWRNFGVIHILFKKNPAIFCGVCLLLFLSPLVAHLAILKAYQDSIAYLLLFL